MYDRKIKNYSNFFKVLSNDVRIKIPHNLQENLLKHYIPEVKQVEAEMN